MPEVAGKRERGPLLVPRSAEPEVGSACPEISVLSREVTGEEAYHQY